VVVAIGDDGAVGAGDLDEAVFGIPDEGGIASGDGKRIVRVVSIRIVGSGGAVGGFDAVSNGVILVGAVRAVACGSKRRCYP
jgi:hypothetical protein